MDNNLEDKVSDCPFKTERGQCLLLKEKKESETYEQNFPCNYTGDYRNCEIYLEYSDLNKE